MKVSWASVCKKWGIFDCFLTAFCSSKDRIVLFYDIIKVWKTRVISSNEDRSVSISCCKTECCQEAIKDTPISCIQTPKKPS